MTVSNIRTINKNKNKNIIIVPSIEECRKSQGNSLPWLDNTYTSFKNWKMIDSQHYTILPANYFQHRPVSHWAETFLPPKNIHSVNNKMLLLYVTDKDPQPLFRWQRQLEAHRPRWVEVWWMDWSTVLDFRSFALSYQWPPLVSCNHGDSGCLNSVN